MTGQRRGIPRRDFVKSAVAIGGTSALSACIGRFGQPDVPQRPDDLSREFLRTAGGSVTAATAASESVATQESGGRGTTEVKVGPGGSRRWDPEEVEIAPAPR